MNKAAIIMALADGPPVEYRAVGLTGPATTSITKPSGLEVGDLVLVWALGVAGGTTLTTAGGSTWTLVHDSGTQPVIGTSMRLYAKVMTSLDVSAAWNTNSAVSQGALAVRYAGHGATTVTMQSTKDQSGGINHSLVLTGFTKAAGHYGTVAFAITNDTTAAASYSAGFTKQSETVFNSAVKASVGDQTYGYVDGSSVTISNLNPAAPAGHQCYAVLLEITGS